MIVLKVGMRITNHVKNVVSGAHHVRAPVLHAQSTQEDFMAL